MKKQNKKLVVFDMDFTISEGFLEEAYFLAMGEQERQVEYAKGRAGQDTWPNIIQNAVQKYPPCPFKVNDYLSRIPAVEGMKKILEKLKQMPQVETAILSGGNQFLVRQYLEVQGFTGLFSHIFANPSHYNDHNGTYAYENKLSKCEVSFCRQNECKAFYLEEVIQTGRYQHIFYVGDGLNDLCGMSLIKNGKVYIRKNKQLEKRLTNIQVQKVYQQYLRVNHDFWKDGNELYDGITKDVAEAR